MVNAYPLEGIDPAINPASATCDPITSRTKHKDTLYWDSLQSGFSAKNIEVIWKVYNATLNACYTRVGGRRGDCFKPSLCTCSVVWSRANYLACPIFMHGNCTWINSLLLNDSYIFILSAPMCACIHVCARASDLLELELRTVAGCYVVAGDWTWVLWESRQYSYNTEPSLQIPNFLITRV